MPLPTLITAFPSTHSFTLNSSSSRSNNSPKKSPQPSINLSQKGLTAEQLLHLSSNFPLESNITTLKLGFNDFKDEGAIVISSLLHKNRSITCLDLGFCNIGDQGIEAISNALLYNHTLKILYLSGNQFSEAGFKCLGNALSVNKSLQALYLTGNAGKAEGVKYISKGLQFNRSLQKLYINGNKIDKEGASSICDTLMTNHTITSLSLSDNNIGDSGLLSLSEAMANHRNLQELELSFNKITSIGIGPFIDSAVGYNSLRRLLLDNNKLGDVGAKSLALALPHMQIHELNIGFNDISTDGLLAIIGSISSTPSIRVIALSGNTIDNTVAKVLANLLMLNSQITALHVDRTNMTSEAERFIGAGIASNRSCNLRVLTGFELGKVLTLLGSPAQVGDMSNETALRYLGQMWADVERANSIVYQTQSPQQQLQHQYPPQLDNSGRSNQNLAADSISPCSTKRKQDFHSSFSQSTGNNSPLLSSAKRVSSIQTIIRTSKKLKEVQFNSAEYWSLHQYFYSPPSSNSSPSSPTKSNHVTKNDGELLAKTDESETDESVVSEIASGNLASTSAKASPRAVANRVIADSEESRPAATKRPMMFTSSDDCGHDSPNLDANSRPTKKHGNRHTIARINNYQTVKCLLEGLKAKADENKSFQILRQLKYLEETLNFDPVDLEKLYLNEVYEK